MTSLSYLKYDVLDLFETSDTYKQTHTKKMCTIGLDFQKLEQTSEEMLLLGTSKQETSSCISVKLLCPLQAIRN